MKDEAIRELARLAGIAVDWIDAAECPHQVSMASLRRILSELRLPCSSAGDFAESCDRLRHAKSGWPLRTTTLGQSLLLDDASAGAAELVLEDGTRQAVKLGAAEKGALLPPVHVAGYHRLRYGEHDVGLAVAPARCFALSDVAGARRLWGLSVQLYSLRRPGDLGTGDTTALRVLAEEAGRRGADALAISPLHSLFPADPGRYSPYSPSNRQFLNPLLIDPADALGPVRVAAAGMVAPEETAGLIDWPEAARAKYGLLRRLFADFSAGDLARGTSLARRFKDFVRGRGDALQAHAEFEARQDRGASVEYFLFLQWIADAAVAATQAAAKAVGMSIGLIADLAVGVNRDGSEFAAHRENFLGDLNLGAPPDLFNPKGQDWGVTSFSPLALTANGFAPFIATLQANMRHAGGLRIDHAMGLMRLWLVPQDMPPSEGAYLAYPFEDLIRLLALESHRHRAVVIGEDLGTVPAEFRRQSRAAGLAGMDVLWFQRDGTRFLPSSAWRGDAVAMTTTHDLPTVAGWWRGADLELRRAIGLSGAEEIGNRSADRERLWRAFTQDGVAKRNTPATDQPAPVVDAAIDFVARSPAPLALVPLEDVAGAIEQPNLPGTIDEHPNWRRRFTASVGELLKEPAAARRLDLLKAARP